MSILILIGIFGTLFLYWYFTSSKKADQVCERWGETVGAEVLGNALGASVLGLWFVLCVVWMAT